VSGINWPERGQAPLGYVEGVAVTFWRVYCKINAADAAAVAMAMAATADAQRDGGTKQKMAIRRTAVLETPMNRACACDAHITGSAHIAGLAIADLGLVDYAQEAAAALLAAHPNVVFTSGRRSVKQQADAMAGNVVQNPKWIEQTYAANSESKSLQKWVDDHPEATTKIAISSGLEAIMSNWTDAEKKTLSRHFSGQAFDVQPVADGDAIKETIRSLPNLHLFLESRGGLTRWHADFEKVQT
jgi:hypothetical protein